MHDRPTRTSELVRQRAAGKTLRGTLIKWREAYFDLLVSGYSIEQIASHMGNSSLSGRPGLGEAVA